MTITTENVVQICVALDIAIIGIAYPILIDKIANIGQRYSSINISNTFEKETSPNFSKKIKIPISGKWLKAILYTTLLSFVFLIFNFHAPDYLDFWLIHNSAYLLVIISSVLLVFYFFLWLEKALLYVGNSSRLLAYFIEKYKVEEENNSKKSLYRGSINDICLYAITRQDALLQKALEIFYYNDFKKYREQAFQEDNLTYPIEYYELVHQIHFEVSLTTVNRLRVLEHRAVSGIWLVGEFSNSSKISKSTYNWLWRNLSLISLRSDLVHDFWQNSYQQIQYSLKRIAPKHELNPFRITNTGEIENRDAERKQFFEFHYALGGLLLYQKQYDTITKMLTFTQSEPPTYPLLPSSMTEVFEWFDYFRNDYYHLDQPLDYRYWFSGLNTYGSEKKSTTWICYYLVILFFWMFTQRNRYSHQSLAIQPKLPEDLNKLRSWKSSVVFFRDIINELLKEQNTIACLGFKDLINVRIEEISNLIGTLIISIDEKIGVVKRETPLSEEKIKSFYSSTKEIITDAINDYKEISNHVIPPDLDIHYRTGIMGAMSFYPKSAFVDNDIPHFNFDSSLAERVANANIRRFIPNSFIGAATMRYALHERVLVQGLLKIIGDKKDVIIVGVNLHYEYENLLRKSEIVDYLKIIPATDYHIKNFLYVLQRKDLPFFENVKIPDEEIKNAQLTILDAELNLYASVVDYNLPENAYIKDKYVLEDDPEPQELKLLIFISFIISVNWSKSRKIIQINISSQDNEQGSITKVEDLQEL